MANRFGLEDGGRQAPGPTTGGSGGGPATVPFNVMGNPTTTVSGRYTAPATMRGSTNNAAAARRASSGTRAPSGPPASAAGPVAPSVDDYLGSDSGYQQQLRELANALAQFTGDVTKRRGDLTTEYGLSKKAMEDQKVKDLDLMEDDFGARGVIRSGLYGQAVGDYNTEYGKRATDLDRGQTNALAGLDTETNRFKSQQQLSTESAKEAAIRRRAESYGI